MSDIVLSNTSLSLYDEETRKRFQAIKEELARLARRRRTKKTHPSKIKKREGAGGKVFSYVDRPDYQIWLDENFPGWGIQNLRVWTERTTVKNDLGAQEIPILFCVSFELVVNELGFKRTVPCIGSCPISQKELLKESAYDLRLKYVVALTEAFKTGCNWLGAFFDLRVDEESREEPDRDQQAKFRSLLEMVPSEYKAQTESAWSTQTRGSAGKFLKILEEKLQKAREIEKEKSNGRVEH